MKPRLLRQWDVSDHARIMVPNEALRVEVLAAWRAYGDAYGGRETSTTAELMFLSFARGYLSCLENVEQVVKNNLATPPKVRH